MIVFQGKEWAYVDNAQNNVTKTIMSNTSKNKGRKLIFLSFSSHILFFLKL